MPRTTQAGEEREDKEACYPDEQTFHASVERQGAAYATGVLALILSAAVAVTVALWREFRSDWRHHLASLPLSVYFCGVSLVFAYTFVANVTERPAGAIIAAVFILIIVTLSAISRYQRVRELRVSSLTLADEESRTLWPELTGRKVNLVPLRHADSAAMAGKVEETRQHYRLTGTMAFLHVNLIDNRSEFVAALRVTVRKQGESFMIEASGAIAISNTIAYITELIEPISVLLTLTGENLMLQSFRYLLWGEGEVALMVYTILVHHWELTPNDPRIRPTLYLLSS